MSEVLTATELDALATVFYGNWELVETFELDRTVVVDKALIDALKGGRMGEVLAVLDRVIAAEVTLDEYLRLTQGRFAHAPEGQNVLTWLGAQAARARELAALEGVPPAPPYQDVTGFEPPRFGRWHGPDPTATALEAIRPLLDEWMLEPPDDTWFRQHHVIDLDVVVGVVAPPLDVGEDGEPDWGRAVPTSLVSLGVERRVSWTTRGDQRDEGTYRVAFARPELPLDLDVRQRFPDLRHLFGGYYGQPFDDEHGYPMQMTAEAMTRVRGSCRERMRAQLAALLTIGSDDELIATVGHLGSYCLPYDMRHWIDRLNWKIDALDWGPPVLPRDDPPPAPRDA